MSCLFEREREMPYGLRILMFLNMTNRHESHRRIDMKLKDALECLEVHEVLTANHSSMIMRP